MEVFLQVSVTSVSPFSSAVSCLLFSNMRLNSAALFLNSTTSLLKDINFNFRHGNTEKLHRNKSEQRNTTMTAYVLSSFPVLIDSVWITLYVENEALLFNFVALQDLKKIASCNGFPWPNSCIQAKDHKVEWKALDAVVSDAATGL